MLASYLKFLLEIYCILKNDSRSNWHGNFAATRQWAMLYNFSVRKHIFLI